MRGHKSVSKASAAVNGIRNAPSDAGRDLNRRRELHRAQQDTVKKNLQFTIAT